MSTSSVCTPPPLPSYERACPLLCQELARRKRNNWKSLELASLFLSRLPPAANKADIYQLAAPLGGHKQVFFSYLSNSAVLVLDSREDALQFEESSVEAVRTALGPSVKLKLVCETVPVMDSDEGETADGVVGDQAGRRSSGCISDPAVCRDLMQSLLAAQVPVVVDFHQYKQVAHIKGENLGYSGVGLILG